MRLLLGIHSQRGDKWLAEMERRRRKAKRSESLTRGQIMQKHGISETEIRKEAHWWKSGAGSCEVALSSANG